MRGWKGNPSAPSTQGRKSTMEYWQGPARWINTILLVIVGFVGFATLFELLGAREENLIVRFVTTVAGVFLAPFQGMFDDQEFLLTAIIAVLGYSLLAGIALAVVRSVQASRQERMLRREPGVSRSTRRTGSRGGPPPPPPDGRMRTGGQGSGGRGPGAAGHDDPTRPL